VQTQKPDQQAADDGDLPPREVNSSEAPTSTSHAPGTVQQPNDVTGDIASELPVRAGFNLAAMRAVIEDIEGDGESQRDVSGLARPEISPPLPPQGTVKENSLFISSPEPTLISEYRSGTPATSISHGFKSRPRSLNDTRDARSFGSQNAAGDADEDDFTLSTPSSSTFTPHSHVAADSTLSSKGDYKASWIPGASEKDIFGGYGTQSGGNSFHSTPFAAGDLTALPPNTSNASLPVSVADRDPWSFPSYSGDVSASAGVKKPSMFASNPWEG
jgi:hypothetical protein